MSEHAWTLENLAAYVAGGLDAAERERLKRHADDCADCGRALADARHADRQLMTLFADVRPSPALEDRLIRTLREPHQSRRRGVSAVWIKATLAIAAVALLAVIGAGITAVIDNDWMPAFVSGKESGGREDDLSHMAKAYYDPTPVYETLGLGTGSMAAFGRQTFKAPQFAEWSDDLFSGGYDGKPNTHFTSPGVRRVDEANQLQSPPYSVAQGAYQAKNKTEKAAVPPRVPVRGFADTNGSITGLPPTVDIDREVASLEKQLKEVHKEPPSQEPYFSPYLNILPRDHRPSPDAPTLNKPRTEGAKAIQTATGALTVTSPPKVETSSEGLDKRAGIWGHLPEKVRTEAVPGGDKKPDQPRPTPRYVIRTGDIEFEVDSFDAAAAIVRKLVVATKGAIVATENSDRLVNGKVRGAIVVRMPPEQLDMFVLDLRRQLGKTGELKGQKIGSQDVSKTYIDLESRLKAARTMEERLLKIIKDGKGEIKDLVAAEKELGVWNTKIEELEGELRYYQNLVSLSTLTINLTEKEIRVAAAVRESERIQAGVEVDDVETAMREVLKAVDDAKGRVTRSELKQHTGGQFNAVLDFEVVPTAAGPIRDRLRQLGTIARLEIDRAQTPEGGDKLPPDGKLERGNTRFILALYNLANVTPQETVVLRVAAGDVAEAYRTVRAAVVKAKGRIMGADLDQKSPQQVGANLTFAVPREGELAIRAALGESGEVLSRSVTRMATPQPADGKDQAKLVTDKRVEYKLELISAAAIEPRETVALAVEVGDVEETLDVLTGKVKELKGRVVKGPESAHELNGRVTAFVVYDVPLAAEPALSEKLRNSGQVRAKKTVPNQQALEGKLAVARFVVTLANADVLLPRDEGLWAQVRNGLSFSLRGLSMSVNLLIVGVLFVLPWLLLIAGVWWLVRRIWGRPAVVTPTPPTPPAASA